MSVDIAVVNTAIKVIKLLNRKIEMENEVTENEINNEIKVQTEYWHECLHCSRQHSNKSNIK